MPMRETLSLASPSAVAFCSSRAATNADLVFTMRMAVADSSYSCLKHDPFVVSLEASKVEVDLVDPLVHIGEIAIDAVDSAVLLVLKLLDDHLHVSNVLS